MATVGDMTVLPKAIVDVKPTVLYSVPTLYKKVYDGIQAKVSPISTTTSIITPPYPTIDDAVMISMDHQLQTQTGVAKILTQAALKSATNKRTARASGIELTGFSAWKVRRGD